MKKSLLVVSILALVAIAIPGILWAHLDEKPIAYSDNTETEQLFSVSTLQEITPGGSATGALSKYSLGKIGYDVSGDCVVWNQAKNGSDADVMLYNAAEKTLQSITTDTAEQVSPRIDGNKVVWMENLTSNVGGESRVASDLWVYDIATKKKTKLVENRNMQPYPDVQGDKVVWSEWNGSQWDIHLYKLSPASGEAAESQITDSQSKKLYPRIDGNKVAWQDNRNQNYDVFQYDIAAGTTEQLTENTSDQTRPVAAGSKTFWTDERYSPSRVAFFDSAKNDYYYMAKESTTTSYDFNLGGATPNGVAAIQSMPNGSYTDINICFYDFRIGGWHPINKSGAVRSVPQAAGLAPEADGRAIVWAEVASETPGTIRLKMATIVPTNYGRSEVVLGGVGQTRLGKNFSPMAIGLKNSVMVGEREDVLSSDTFGYLNYFEDNVSWRDYRGQPSDIVVEDINDDGLNDMLLLSQTGAGDAVGNFYPISLIVYEQDAYPKQKLYRKGAYSISGSVMAVGDVNGDGLKDVVTRDNSAVYVLLRKAGGGFDRLPTRYALPTAGTATRGSIQLADINGDGINDVLATAKTTTNGVVYVFTSNKDGKLSTAKPYSTLGNDPRGMALVDLNGDLTKEVVVANYASASIGILKQANGVLTSDSTVTASTNPEEVRAGDVVPSSSADYMQAKPEVLVLDKKNKKLQAYNPSAGTITPWFTLPVRSTGTDISFAVGDVYEDKDAVWQGTTTEWGQTLGAFTERYQDVVLCYGNLSTIDTYSFKNYVAPGAAVNPDGDYVCTTKKVNETMTKSIIAAGDVGMYGERTGHGALKYDHGQTPNLAYTCTGTCHTHPQNGNCSGDCHRRKGSVSAFSSVSFGSLAKRSIEETSTDITYSGVWTSSTGKFSGGTAKFTSRAGDSLTLTFTGTGVTWNAYIPSTLKTPNRAEVYIDSDPNPATVDLASFTPGYNVPVFTKENLEDGIHTVTIKAIDGGTSGPYTWVDSFDIYQKSVSFSIAAVNFDISEDSPETYKICLKCHSVYQNGGGSSVHKGQADVMEQFNTENASFHPLFEEGKNSSIQQGTFTSPSMNALSRVDCDDCHTIGSATLFLTWSSRPLGSQTPSGFTPYLTSLPFIGSSVTQTDYLCYKCHSYNVYYNGGAGSDFEAHKRHIKELSIACEACHDVHGSTKNSRLLKDNIGVDETAPGQGTCSGAPNCHGQRYSY